MRFSGFGFLSQCVQGWLPLLILGTTPQPKHHLRDHHTRRRPTARRSVKILTAPHHFGLWVVLQPGWDVIGLWVVLQSGWDVRLSDMPGEAHATNTSDCVDAHTTTSFGYQEH
jgi:hypothetical protein